MAEGWSGKRNPIVPARRSMLLKELLEHLNSVGNVIKRLEEASTPELFDELADKLDTAFVTATNMAPARYRTGCQLHPWGPVDTEAPEGWGACATCNRNRRIGRPWVTAAESQPKHGYDMPSPPYTFKGLQDRLYLINDAVMALLLDSPDDEIDAIANALYGAFIVARELSRPKPESRCEKHRYTDTAPDPVTGGCVLCAVEARWAAAGTARVGVVPRPPRKVQRSLRRRYEYKPDDPPQEP